MAVDSALLIFCLSLSFLCWQLFGKFANLSLKCLNLDSVRFARWQTGTPTLMRHRGIVSIASSVAVSATWHADLAHAARDVKTSMCQQRPQRQVALLQLRKQLQRRMHLWKLWLIRSDLSFPASQTDVLRIAPLMAYPSATRATGRG